nr:MAG TPA: hypothetical protein [Caudoviricetes sp.]
MGCLLLTIKKQIEDKRCVPEWGKSMGENSHVPCCFIYQQSAIRTVVLMERAVCCPTVYT